MNTISLMVKIPKYLTPYGSLLEDLVALFQMYSSGNQKPAADKSDIAERTIISWVDLQTEILWFCFSRIYIGAMIPLVVFFWVREGTFASAANSCARRIPPRRDLTN